MPLRRPAWSFAVLVVAFLTALTVQSSSAALVQSSSAARASDSPVARTSTQQVDILRPANLGWDNKEHAYHFRVYWTWQTSCGHYCLINDVYDGDGEIHTIADPDIVSMAFDKRMQVVRVRLVSHGACRRHSSSSSRLVGPDSGWDNASSQIQDSVYPDEDPCANTEKHSVCGPSNPPACRTWYSNASMSYGYYHVWAKPVQGCNRRMRVRTFYAHSWSSTSISISGSFPLGVSISGSKQKNWWQVSERTDASADPDLITTVCRTPR